jgi:hypothetical protein
LNCSLAATPRFCASQGLPVFYAPGEAEAAAVALQRLGCVDAVASPDADALVYGAEALLHTLKLQVGSWVACFLSTRHPPVVFDCMDDSCWTVVLPVGRGSSRGSCNSSRTACNAQGHVWQSEMASPVHLHAHCAVEKLEMV